MAPFSPLPVGYSPRSPKALPHPRPFAHIFGQTLPLPSRPPQDPPIICGPESKGWMACLALSCFLVVVWMAALPEGSGRSVAAMERDEIIATRGLHDFGDGMGMGAGLLWLYDEPTPIVGFGLGTSRRDEGLLGRFGAGLGGSEAKRDETASHESEGEEVSKAEEPKKDTPKLGPAVMPAAKKEDIVVKPAVMPGKKGDDDEDDVDDKDDDKDDGKDDDKDERRRGDYDDANDSARSDDSHGEDLALDSSGNEVQYDAPAQVSSSSSPAVLARQGPAERGTPSPTPTPTAGSSFVKIKRAPTASSSTFSSPPFADSPSAQQTNGSDDDAGDGSASAPAPTPSSVAGLKNDERRSRFRRSGH